MNFRSVISEPKKIDEMLVHADHIATLQTALLEFREKTDGSILFHCSDGKIEVKSTFLKLHSKLLNQMIADAYWLKILFIRTKKKSIASILMDREEGTFCSK